jgi:vacuolar protein sorting-associated protein 13A/C
LGDLTLSIPWSDIKNKPVKIFINNLLVLAAPKGEREYDAKAEEEYEYQVKMSKINAMEESSKDSAGLSNEQNATFISQLVTKIVDNVQISIKNIHIRYEDKISNKDPFSVGVSIEELSAHSTDENWMEAFISSSTGLIHKLLKLSNLAVYWNTDGQSFAGMSPSEFRDALSGTIINDTGGPITWQYVMRPVSGMGKVKICRRPQHGQAKYATDLNFEDLAFVMDDIQYATIFSLFDSFNMYIRSSQYRKFRPSLTSAPKTHPLDWFRYAGTAVLSGIQEKYHRWSWDYFKQRRDDRKSYIDVYTRHRRGTASATELALQSQLERKLSYSDIRLYRYIANELLAKENAKLPDPSKTQATSPVKSWGDWWYGSDSTTDAAAKIPIQVDPGQLRQLYETIDFNPEKAYTEDFSHPEDILVDLSWKLKTGSATLKKNHDSKKDVLVRMKFDGFSATVIQRPTSWFFAVDLLNMALEDKTTPGSLFPNVIESKIQEQRYSNL